MRKPISKKLRFEVFKRDSFTCQYCGKSAPDVILNVDHIKPVKLKGTNDILNLITSCFDCNSGKKATELSDQSVLKKQLSQLDELNEKRNQLELMVKWRDGLKNIDDEYLLVAVKEIEDKIAPHALTDSFKKDLKLAIKKYGINKLLDAVDIAYEKYKDITDFLDKIIPITKNICLPELEQKINFICGIASNKFNHEYNSEFWKIKSFIKNYCDALKEYWLFDDKQLIDDLQNEILPMLNEREMLSHFKSTMFAWTNQIKGL